MSPAKIASAPESLNEIATLRIELKDTDPLTWRQVEVPTSITLKVLHDIIQITIGWFDYHLWEFTIGEQRYGLPWMKTGEPSRANRRLRSGCARCSRRKAPSWTTSMTWGIAAALDEAGLARPRRVPKAVRRPENSASFRLCCVVQRRRSETRVRATRTHACPAWWCSEEPCRRTGPGLSRARFPWHCATLRLWLLSFRRGSGNYAIHQGIKSAVVSKQGRVSSGIVQPDEGEIDAGSQQLG